VREYLSADDIANNAMMLGETGRTIVVVEGITDRRLYGKFLDPSVDVVIAHSKSNVMGAVKLAVKRRGCAHVIGIVDADLDRLKSAWVAPQLFLTDTRDSETLMLRSDAYDDVMAEFGDRDRIGQFEKRHGSIRDAVTDAAYPLGIMMFVSDKYGWKLSFKELDFSRFIDRNSLSIDVCSFIRELASAKVGAPDREIMQQMLNDEMVCEKDVWQVCRGHDAMNILALGLRNIFGSFNSKHITDSALSGAFRLAFDREEFSETDLYKESKEWSDRTGHVLWKVIRS